MEIFEEYKKMMKDIEEKIKKEKEHIKYIQTYIKHHHERQTGTFRHMKPTLILPPPPPNYSPPPLPRESYKDWKAKQTNDV